MGHTRYIYVLMRQEHIFYIVEMLLGTSVLAIRDAFIYDKLIESD